MLLVLFKVLLAVCRRGELTSRVLQALVCAQGRMTS